MIRCSQHTFLLALASLFVCWEISDSIAKTCDEDDAKVVQVEAKEFYEKGVSLKELKKLLETQAVNEAFVMVNPTQRSIHEQSVISASSSKGEGLTAKRKYSGRQVSHKSIEARYIKPIGELKIIEQQGFTFVMRRMEISVCKIKEEALKIMKLFDRFNPFFLSQITEGLVPKYPIININIYLIFITHEAIITCAIFRFFPFSFYRLRVQKNRL